jgi:hypothetical protein
MRPDSRPRPLCAAVPALLATLAVLAVTHPAAGRVVATSGTAAIEPDPHAEPADGVIFVYDEQQDVAFVSTQPLEFGAIVPGTLVDSHYVQFDPVTATGSVGMGSISFDGPILGLATSTAALTADLTPEAPGTSDSYFGLESTLGPYPTGAVASARGLGSPQDDLVVTIGSPVLTINSLEIPLGGGGNLDGFRVFTAARSETVPTPASRWILPAALLAVGATLLGRPRSRT